MIRRKQLVLLCILYTLFLGFAAGCISQSNLSGEVPPNVKPSCSLSTSPNSGNTPRTVTFSMSASDTDGKISSWSLDIDNNGSAEYSGSLNPPSKMQHTYTSAGTYKAKLRVTDNEGATDEDTSTVYAFDEDLPAGEIGGLHYVWWDFGINNFKSLYVDITIYNEPDNNDGLYFQMYQGTINGVGFYYGLQTRVYNPNDGLIKKGLIYSRWETRDLSNVRTIEGGWSQSAGYEGNFVGIRKYYNWTNHSYRFKLAYMESDDTGDWYGIWIYDSDNFTEDFLGSIRFPPTEASKSGIANGGVTWTELYYKGIKQTPIPSWHASINGIYAREETIPPNSATSAYSSIAHTDIYYDQTSQKIHFIMGPEVNREHNAGRLFLN